MGRVLPLAAAGAAAAMGRTAVIGRTIARRLLQGAVPDRLLVVCSLFKWKDAESVCIVAFAVVMVYQAFLFASFKRSRKKPK